MRKSRRDFVKTAGLGVFGTSLVSRLTTVDRCVKISRQELGPFAPMKYRGQADHDIDLTQLFGQECTAAGEIISLNGKITDTHCQPIAGAIVEIWQANHYGKYRHEYDDEGKSDPNFQG